MTPRRVVVVGASLAGATTAMALRRLGHDGDLVLVGDEHVPPYERPELSKGYLAGRVGVEQLLVHPADAYAEAGIELRLGRAATGLDVARRTVRLADGTEEPYDACVLATGSANVVPPFEGVTAPGVHQVRRLEDADRLAAAAATAERAVVVGSGPLGCEVAATLRGRGLAVTVLDRLESPMLAQVGPQLSARVRGWHEQHDVAVLGGVQVAAIRTGGPAGAADGVLLADGRVLDADLVVVAVGARPATDWLVPAGLQLVRGAVAVDADGRASAPGVHAAGDVAAVRDGATGTHRRAEHYRAALDQAARVAGTVLGRPVPAASTSWFWSEQYDHVLHYAGDRDGAQLHERRHPYTAFFTRGQVLTAVATVDNGRDFGRALRLLGTDVDPALLTDPDVDLRRLAPAAVAS